MRIIACMRSSRTVLSSLSLLLLLPVPGNSQKAADWPMFNRDLAGTRYSPLTQINTGNVSKL
jgi:glucose dehydrogenase